MQFPDDAFESAARARGARYVAGVDEVGRGPWAGPVVAAAVWLDPECLPEGLNDSKQLNAERRQELALQIRACGIVSIAEASVEEIDALNILAASHLAMQRAVAGLAVAADHLLIDGNLLPKSLPCGAEAIIGGDGRSVSIAAASIVAKVHRDALMARLADHHPHYGWETNAGYGTKKHQQGLRDFGVTPHHRRSFKPVHNILYQAESVSP